MHVETTLRTPHVSSTCSHTPHCHIHKPLHNPHHLSTPRSAFQGTPTTHHLMCHVGARALHARRDAHRAQIKMSLTRSPAALRSCSLAASSSSLFCKLRGPRVGAPIRQTSRRGRIHAEHDGGAHGREAVCAVEEGGRGCIQKGRKSEHGGIQKGGWQGSAEACWEGGASELRGEVKKDRRLGTSEAACGEGS